MTHEVRYLFGEGTPPAAAGPLLHTHEQEGVLRLRASEHAAVAALGVHSRATGAWIGY